MNHFMPLFATTLAVFFPAEDLPLHNLYRFPGPGACCDAITFNDHFQTCLKYRQAEHASYWHEYQEVICDCEWRWSVWQELSAAECEELDLETRLRAFHNLRKNLGEEAFWAGRMPFPIPLSACYGD